MLCPASDLISIVSTRMVESFRKCKNYVFSAQKYAAPAQAEGRKTCVYRSNIDGTVAKPIPAALKLSGK